MPRMNILNKSEQEMFDAPPVFSSAERKRFCNFPDSLKEKTETLRKPSTKIGFLLFCGYFKATKRFFKPEEAVWKLLFYAKRLNIMRVMAM